MTVCDAIDGGKDVVLLLVSFFLSMAFLLIWPTTDGAGGLLQIAFGQQQKMNMLLLLLPVSILCFLCKVKVRPFLM